MGIEAEHADIFGKSGLLEQDLRILEVLQKEIRAATKTIDRLAQEDPRVKLILPIRGIGRYSAMLILAEIGDIGRFSDLRS